MHGSSDGGGGSGSSSWLGRSRSCTWLGRYAGVLDGHTHDDGLRGGSIDSDGRTRALRLALRRAVRLGKHSDADCSRSLRPACQQQRCRFRRRCERCEGRRRGWGRGGEGGGRLPKRPPKRPPKRKEREGARAVAPPARAEGARRLALAGRRRSGLVRHVPLRHIAHRDLRLCQEWRDDGVSRGYGQGRVPPHPPLARGHPHRDLLGAGRGVVPLQGPRDGGGGRRRARHCARHCARPRARPRARRGAHPGRGDARPAGSLHLRSRSVRLPARVLGDAARPLGDAACAAARAADPSPRPLPRRL